MKILDADFITTSSIDGEITRTCFFAENNSMHSVLFVCKKDNVYYEYVAYFECKEDAWEVFNDTYSKLFSEGYYINCALIDGEESYL